MCACVGSVACCETFVEQFVAITSYFLFSVLAVKCSLHGTGFVSVIARLLGLGRFRTALSIGSVIRVPPVTLIEHPMLRSSGLLTKRTASHISRVGPSQQSIRLFAMINDQNRRYILSGDVSKIYQNPLSMYKSAVEASAKHKYSLTEPSKIVTSVQRDHARLLMSKCNSALFGKVVPDYPALMHAYVTHGQPVHQMLSSKRDARTLEDWKVLQDLNAYYSTLRKKRMEDSAPFLARTVLTNKPDKFDDHVSTSIAQMAFIEFTG